MSKDVSIKSSALVLEPEDPSAIALLLISRDTCPFELRYDLDRKLFYRMKPALKKDGSAYLNKLGVQQLEQHCLYNEVVKSEIWRVLHTAEKRSRRGELIRFAPTSRHVSQVFAALRAICIDRQAWGLAA